MKLTTLFTYDSTKTAQWGQLAGKAMFAAGSALSGIDAYRNIKADYVDDGSVKLSTYTYNGAKFLTDVTVGIVGLTGIAAIGVTAPIGAAIALTYFAATNFGGMLWNDDTQNQFKNWFDKN